MSNRALIALFLISAMGACRQAPEQPRFPKADRPVAPIVGDSFSTEDARGTGLIQVLPKSASTSLLVDHLTHSTAASGFLDPVAAQKPHE